MLATALLVIVCTTVSSGTRVYGPAALAAEPLETIARLQAAYAHRSVEELGLLLTPDYRYYFADSALQAEHPHWGREDELASARRMFQGGPAADGTQLPAATETEIEWSVLHVIEYGRRGAQDECIVYAPAVRVRIVFAHDVVLTDPMGEWFRLVRGPARAGAAGLVASRRWFIAEWRELTTRANHVLAQPDTARAGSMVAADTADVPAAPPAPRWALSLVPAASNPIRGHAVPLAFTLRSSDPARVELFDVAGRRVDRVDVTPPTPGPHAAVLGSGRLAPGAYWARLTQQRSAVIAKVLVAP